MLLPNCLLVFKLSSYEVICCDNARLKYVRSADFLLFGDGNEVVGEEPVLFADSTWVVLG